MTAVDLAALDREPPAARSTAWWATLLAIATEATLFATVLASDLYLRFNAERWRPPEVPAPELRLPLVGTALLVTSSAVLWWGERGLRQGAVGRFRVGALLTTALGGAFLAVQAAEYRAKTFGIADHAYGSAFYVTTGFHAAHLVVGLGLLVFVQARSWAGHHGPRDERAVTSASAYWHFVDAVWIAVLVTLYLSEQG